MFLIARPMGGLNDILCTIHRCYNYSIHYQRKLIVHTAHHNAKTLFADGIDKYIVARDLSTNIGLDRCEEVVAALPSYFDNSKINRPWKCDIAPNSIDFARGLHNQYMLFHGWGGGHIGVNAFNYLEIAQPIKAYVTAKLLTLPTRYNAIHFRYTDHKSDTDQLWDTLEQLTDQGLPLYLATDSQQILREANIRYPGQILNLTSNLSSTAIPIHHSNMALEKGNVYDMFMDLAILCFAESLHCIKLSNPSTENIDYSGFSILASSMRKLNTSRLRSLFGVNLPEAT